MKGFTIEHSIELVPRNAYQVIYFNNWAQCPPSIKIIPPKFMIGPESADCVYRSECFGDVLNLLILHTRDA